MSETMDILAILGLRFLLFKHHVSDRVRGWILGVPKSNGRLYRVISQLFRCAFCQGWWIGLAVWWVRIFVTGNPLYPEDMVLFGMAAAITSFTWEQWLEVRHEPGR